MGGIGSGKNVRLHKWRRKRFTDEFQRFDAFCEFRSNGRLYEQRDSLPINVRFCHMGGEKYYWLCPSCHRQCPFLYFGFSQGGCRLCLNLAYRSQNETLADRLLRKRDKIQTRISSNYFEKPKYMHEKTFQYLTHLAELYNVMAIQAFLLSARKLSQLQ